MFAPPSRRQEKQGSIRKKRKDAGGKHEQPESKLQVAIVSWGDANDVLIDGSPGGAAFRQGAHTARGCRPGRPDLFVLEGGADGSRGLTVELKIGHRRDAVTTAQEKYMSQLKRRGWRCAVLRARDGSVAARADALSEFISLVQEHMRTGAEDAPLVLD